MKKLLIALLAAASFAVGVKAEGTGTRYNAGAYNIYASSDAVSSATGQTVYSSPAILHKVIISSPSYDADVSTNSVFQIYDGVNAGTRLRAEVNLSTFSLSGGATEYTFDIAMSSGIWTDYSGSVTRGKVNLIYSRPRPADPQKYKVWSSTYMPADTNIHTVSTGPVVLHKIIVLTKGTGTAILSVFDTNGSTTSKKIAGIDLTDAAREYTYNILCSSGITFTSSGAGTVVPSFIALYKRNPSQDYELWQSTFTTGTQSLLAPPTVGPGWIFGGVVNGDSVAGSYLDVYDSTGPATGTIAHFDGGGSFTRKMYDVSLTNGLRYSTSGNGLYTILYKRRND